LWRNGGRRWKIIAVLGISANVLILTAATVPAIFAQLSFLEFGFPIGFIALRIWMVAAAVIMLRWAPPAEHALESSALVMT
jgi:hypothetical protein